VSVYYVIAAGPEAKPPLPLHGFGWDLHLVLPVLALLLRPTVQIAQVTAGLLAGELGKQYITAARSRGNTWARARWRHALSNVLAPVILTIAGSFRLLVGELILVEWLFAWPGLGWLLSLALVPPRIATVSGLSDISLYFLHPPLVAALLTMFTLVFLTVDAVASFAARSVDPRLQVADSH
jgi:ABC-type dipeptide/oligopeptide/nickel transport system permease component